MVVRSEEAQIVGLNRCHGGKHGKPNSGPKRVKLTSLCRLAEVGIDGRWGKEIGRLSDLPKRATLLNNPASWLRNAITNWIIRYRIPSLHSLLFRRTETHA